jgi:hypothetical protein
MKDLGAATFFLGIELYRDRGSKKIYLKQEGYISRLLAQCKMDNCNPASTPMDANLNLTKEDDGDTNINAPYANIVGSLIYLSTTTRFDISYAVGILSRYLSCYKSKHWIAAKRILRYLKGSKSYGICYQQSNDGIKAYSDADFGNDHATRKSTSGTIVLFNNGPIMWRSRRQPIVALSTMESEFIAITNIVQDCIWLHKLLFEIFSTKPDVIIYEDNNACLSLIKNPVHHQKSKHIDIRFQFIRESITNYQFDVRYCNSKQMLADVLTKPLHATMFNSMIAKLNLTNVIGGVLK